MRFSSAATVGGGDVGFLFHSEHTDDQIALCRHHLRGCTCSHLAAVLVHGHIPYPEHPVFDTPMAPPQFQQPAGINLLWWETGYCVSQLSAGLAFVANDAFRPAHLGQMGPVTVVDQFYRFEPPHVHVWVDNPGTCRIDLNSGTFMERPPTGTYREIMKAYRRNSQLSNEIWQSIHGER